MLLADRKEEEVEDGKPSLKSPEDDGGGRDLVKNDQSEDTYLLLLLRWRLLFCCFMERLAGSSPL